MSQTNDILLEISARLDKVLRLLALDVLKGYEKEQEKIALLDSLGFRPVEIAKLLNKSQENVNVVLGSIRKKTEKKVKTIATAQAEPEKTNAQEVKMTEEATGNESPRK
jgi:DNA-directed RNA polymerase specialized sigma24 family protein